MESTSEPGDPPPAPGAKCESCAASKRLKTAPPDGGDSSHWYAKQPCSCTQTAGVAIASALPLTVRGEGFFPAGETVTYVKTVLGQQVTAATDP